MGPLDDARFPEVFPAGRKGNRLNPQTVRARHPLTFFVSHAGLFMRKYSSFVARLFFIYLKKKEKNNPPESGPPLA